HPATGAPRAAFVPSSRSASIRWHAKGPGSGPGTGRPAGGHGTRTPAAPAELWAAVRWQAPASRPSPGTGGPAAGLAAAAWALARVARLRAADWLIVGYVVALVGVTGLVMAVEGMQFLRDHVPSHLGVTVATLARPRAAG